MNNNLWVVMVSKQIADQIRKQLESGRFTEATMSNSLLKAFQDKIQGEVQRTGGHLHVFLPEWMVLEISPGLAEQIPTIVQSFNEQIGYSLAVGIGLDFAEAVKAARQSEHTGEICLFEEEMNKSLELPPNLYDYEDQSYTDAATDSQEQDYTPGPESDQAMQLMAQQLQQIIKLLGGDAMEQANQQVQQIQQQQAAAQEQEQQQPRDMVEGLNGGPVEGRNPYRAKEDSKSDDSDEGDDEDSDEESGEGESTEKEEDSPEGDEVQQKLGNALLHIKEQIPQLMDLAEKNPDAFKQSMALVQKLLSLTKKTKGNTEKSESDELTERLNKRIIFPVGTTKNRKKKVLVDGKQVWRSAASGQVKDLKGEAISVKSSNLAAQKGTQPKEE